jgi:hypothetical protein
MLASRLLVLVQMPVDDTVVCVVVGVESSRSPAHKQPDSKRYDDEADEDLGDLLDSGWQIRAEENDRKSQDEERDRVSCPRRKAEEAGAPQRTLGLAGDQRRDGNQVIRVGRVPKAEEKRDRKHHHASLRCSSLRTGRRARPPVSPFDGPLPPLKLPGRTQRLLGGAARRSWTVFRAASSCERQSRSASAPRTSRIPTTPRRFSPSTTGR